MNLITLALAGSVRSVVGAIADQFAKREETEFELHSGPAGLLADSIYDGLPADIYVSASMAGPQRLHIAGLFGTPRVIAQNWMVLVAGPAVANASDTALDLLADSRWRIGHSTPGADPSGDYVTEFLDSLCANQPELTCDIRSRSACLFGGALPDPAQIADSPAITSLQQGKADIFLVYATTAQRMLREVPGALVFPLPEELSPKTNVCACAKQQAPKIVKRFFKFLQHREARLMFDAAGWL